MTVNALHVPKDYSRSARSSHWMIITVKRHVFVRIPLNTGILTPYLLTQACYNSSQHDKYMLRALFRIFCLKKKRNQQALTRWPTCIMPATARRVPSPKYYIGRKITIATHEQGKPSSSGRHYDSHWPMRHRANCCWLRLFVEKR